MLKKLILLHNLNISDNKERYNERRQKNWRYFRFKHKWERGDG